MKIAIAGGHSKKAPGASKYLDEYQCDRAYVAKLISALTAAGHTVVNCSNEEASQNAELAEEVRLANASGADLFVAVHLNDGSGDPDNKPTGTETWIYENTKSESGSKVDGKFGGTYRCNASKLNVRNAPSTRASVVTYYTRGQTVVLDDRYTIAEGFVWGQYTAYSGKKRYVAVGKHTGKPDAGDYLLKV